MSTFEPHQINTHIINLFYKQVFNEPTLDTALVFLPTFIPDNFYDHSTQSFGPSKLVQLLLSRSPDTFYNILFTISEDDKIAVYWQLLYFNKIISSGVDIYRLVYFLKDGNHIAQIAERWSCKF